MLALSDLCAVSDTCSRFERVARAVFPFEHKRIDLRSIWLNSGKSMSLIRTLLLKFGETISDLTLRSDENDREQHTEMLQLVLEYCRGTLKSLTLSGCRIDNMMAPKIAEAFSSLVSLKLDFCTFDASISPNLFLSCQQLVTMSINQCSTECLKAALECFYPQLTRLSLAPKLESRGNVSGASASNETLQPVQIYNEIQQFLQNHKTVEELELFANLHSNYSGYWDEGPFGCLDVLNHFCNDKFRSLRLWKFLVDKSQIDLMKRLLSNLESLALFKCSIDVPRDAGLFSECNKVTKLKIKNYDLEFFKCTKNDFPNLRYLDFDYTIDYESYDYNNELSESELNIKEFLGSHKTLKEISITFSDNNESILKFIAENMKSLVKIDLCYLDSEVYSCMRTALPTIGDITKLKLRDGYLYPSDLGAPDRSHDMSIFLNKMDNSVDSLVHLELHSYLNRRMLASIMKFQNLLRLKLHIWGWGRQMRNVEKDEQLQIEPFGNLPKLSTFHLGGDLQLSCRDLLQFVTKAEKLRLLTFDLRVYKIESSTYEKIFDVVHKRNQSLTVSEEVNNQWPDAEIYIERRTYSSSHTQ